MDQPQKKEPLQKQQQQHDKVQRNFYELLNSLPTARYEELKANYQQLIRKCHPDKLRKVSTADDYDDDIEERNIAGEESYNTADNGGDDGGGGVGANDPYITVAEADDFVAINEAWQTLKDTAKRQLYDAELLAMKFQMHSNTFERLRLTDMRRVPLIHDCDECDDDEDEDNMEESNSEGIVSNCGNSGQHNAMVHDEEKTKTPSTGAMTADGVEEVQRISTTTTTTTVEPTITTTKTKENEKRISSWCYTYDCRCGGQYILDESELNGFLSTDDVDRTAEVVVECSECSLVIVLEGGMGNTT